jgi:UDP-2,3-diacylglucosamine pyrophosphatase LpxH
MSQDPTLTHERLDEIWANPSVPTLKIKGNKYILFSDFHLGDGGRADDSWENRHVIRTALEYYGGLKYTLLLLGDIEEMWQFDLPEIRARYDGTIYRAMRGFGDNRVIRVFGNHDGDWCIRPDPAKNKTARHLQATEAVKLIDEKGKARILLVHGHQGDTHADKNSWSSRIVVRLFRLFEPAAVMLGIVHAPKMRHEVVKYYERVMYSWAKKVKTILICGHSHNAIFASQSYADRLREQISQLKRQIKRARLNRELVINNRAENADTSGISCHPTMRLAFFPAISTPVAGYLMTGLRESRSRTARSAWRSGTGPQAILVMKSIRREDWPISFTESQPVAAMQGAGKKGLRANRGARDQGHGVHLLGTVRACLVAGPSKRGSSRSLDMAGIRKKI